MLHEASCGRHYPPEASSLLSPCILKVPASGWKILYDGGEETVSGSGEERGCKEAKISVMKSSHEQHSANYMKVSTFCWVDSLH